MGTAGYRYADVVAYRRDEVILEVGGGRSTYYLAALGPLVVTVDVDPATCDRLAAVPNVEVRRGHAEDVLADWNRPVGFAWLDGYDWPYTGNSRAYYADQRESYERRGQPYSQVASRHSHLTVARLIVDHVRAVAFDDTWRTHSYRSTGDRCVETAPPATPPAPRLALDQPIGRSVCGLPADHPHHDYPDRGWNGKGGTAVPYLVDRGFAVVDDGPCFAVLARVEDDA